MIDDLKTIEKSKRVQWDQQAGYRELFRHSQIWERQAAIACRGSFVCFIPIHSIPAGAHKRTKNPIFIVYNFDSDPELKNQKFYSHSVWNIARLEVR